MSGCPRCHAPLAPDALACPSCHALRYASDLERLSTRARDLEANGNHGLSRAAWLEALAYLPPNTTQAAWILNHIREIDALPDTGEAESPAATHWVARLGAAGPIVLLLIKGKGVFALLNPKTLLTLGGFMAYYAQAFGWAFGVGFGAQILVHELGHYVDIRRRGLPADMPVFLPGLGAYVRWRALGVPDVVRAQVSLAGPASGAIAAATCAVVFAMTGAPIWAALARGRMAERDQPGACLGARRRPGGISAGSIRPVRRALCVAHAVAAARRECLRPRRWRRGMAPVHG